MSTEIITQADVEKLVPAVQAQAREITVVTPDDYEMAGCFLQRLTERKSQVEEVFNPIVNAAHLAHKEAVKQKNKFMLPLLEAEVAVKAKVSKWLTDKETERRAKERQEAALAHQEAQERATAEAAQLRLQGEHELADMVVEEQAMAPAPVVVLPSEVPKADGISSREVWKYRVVDESKVPREYLMINHTALGAAARSQKSLARIPGIEIYSEKTVAVRGG